jgi:hypothetical protein
MTPTELRTCLASLRWSQRGLADALARPEGTVRQWARGAVQIPEPVAAWLVRAAAEVGPHHDAAEAWHAANPPPARD